MQNIPGIALENREEQLKAVGYSKVSNSDQQLLFADLFDQHSARIENELALKPVSTNDKMLDVAPETEADQNKAEVLAPAQDKAPAAADNDVHEEEQQRSRDRDKKMTNEDFDEVKNDLEEYGMTEEEIAAIEEEINSEEGMTWGQFVSVVAGKMNEMRKVSLSDDQRENLSTFFGKFGFTPKESAKLVKQLENGNQNEVMVALRKKMDSMPEGKQLLFSKDEMEAFSVSMKFSSEFSSKLQDMFGKRMLPKELKDAFAEIRQELAAMDQKDRKLVHAVGKQFVQAVGKQTKESSVAKEVNEAIDLKQRVAEENFKGETKEEVRENFREAMDNRKEAMPANNARSNSSKAVPVKAEVDVNADGNNDQQEDDHWHNFFSKLQNRSDQGSGGLQQFQGKTDNIESLLRNGLVDINGKTDTKGWEKVSAPKVMRQVENGFLQTLQNGAKQLTLQLTPEHLGKLTVMLQVQGKEVNATIRAESPEAARMIAENIDIIKSSLESQGLKVEKLDVQAGLSEDFPQNDWFGANEHNLSREREQMVAMRKHMKNMREGNSTLAQDLQSNDHQATVADQGLHIVA